MARIYLTRDLSRGVAVGVSSAVADGLAAILRRDNQSVLLVLSEADELVWLDA